MSLAIVLDTNILYADVYAGRPWLRTLFAGAARGDFTVVVPDTVIRELSGQFPMRLTKAIDDGSAAIGRLRTEYRALNIPLPSVAQLDLGRLTSNYEREIRRTLEQPGCRIARTPTDTGPTLQWALERRRPFKSSGAGLPDAIIWLTILSLAAEYDDVIFVTANRQDFCEGGEGGEGVTLAPELLGDLAARGIPVERVRVVTDLRELLDQVVSPMAEAAIEGQRLVDDPGASDRLTAAIAGAITYLPIDEAGLDLDVDLDEDPQPSAVFVEDIRLSSARRLSDLRLVLEATCLASMTVTLLVPRDQADFIGDDNEIVVIDPERSDRYAEAQVDLVAVLRVEVTTDGAAESVDVEVIDVRRAAAQEIVERRIAAGGAASLSEAINDAVGARLPVSEYVPPYGLTSTTIDAFLESFQLDSAAFEEDDFIAGWEVDCTVRVVGLGDISWFVGAPSPEDFARYRNSVEGDAASGGWLADTASAEPTEILVDVTVSVDPIVRVRDVVHVALQSDELERRQAMFPEFDMPAD